MSSSGRPAKNRISAMRLFRGSNDASFGERPVQIKQVHVWRMANHGVILDHDARPLTGTFRHQPAPGVIDQNPAHQLRCKREKLRTVRPVGLPLIDEPEVGLVHERRGLQDVPRALAAKPTSRLSPQLVVQKLQHLISGSQISLAPGPQQSRYVG